MDDPLTRLTARQREVVALVAHGFTNHEIGIALEISANTIKKHLKNVYLTLDVANRTELATLVTQRATGA